MHQPDGMPLSFLLLMDRSCAPLTRCARQVAPTCSRESELCIIVCQGRAAVNHVLAAKGEMAHTWFKGPVMHTALAPVMSNGMWRVKITWPNGTDHYFGKFASKPKAAEWIAQHRWLTEQTSEYVGRRRPEATRHAGEDREHTPETR
jgi:hypothetical protein